MAFHVRRTLWQRLKWENLSYRARLGLLTSGLLAAVTLALYPIAIEPMLNPEPHRQLSKRIRDENNIRQQDIQPGNMKVWSDPFDRKK